jgi:hypothetical protein
MSDFSSFFKENVIAIGETEFAVSDRFTENFKLKVITEEEHSQIKSAAMKRKSLGKGKYVDEMDVNKYSHLICAASVTYPDLRNSDLQDSYGVKEPDELLNKMLTAGEFTNLLLKVNELNGFDKSFEDDVEEIKN